MDDIVTVPDAETLLTVGMLATGAKLVVEPSGAVAPAAVLFGRSGLRDHRVVALISGGNVEVERLRACLELLTIAAAPAH